MSALTCTVSSTASPQPARPLGLGPCLPTHSSAESGCLLTRKGLKGQQCPCGTWTGSEHSAGCGRLWWNGSQVLGQVFGPPPFCFCFCSLK